MQIRADPRDPWRFLASRRILYPVLRPRLQHHRDNDERDAEDKREAQLVVFLENQHREDDAINGLQIVGEVDCESVNLLQDNDLQQA